MKITNAHRKQINEAARLAAGPGFLRCEVALRCNDELDAFNVLTLLAPGEARIGSTDLQDLVRLSSLDRVEEHPDGARLDIWVYLRGPELYTNLIVTFAPDGTITSIEE